MAEKIDDLEHLTEYNSDDETAAAAKEAETKKEERKKDTHVSMGSAGFKEFLLRPELLRSIIDCGFEHPSEVQHQAIPRAVLGVDILCQAKSGMGKTAVFVLAILQQDPDPKTTSTLVVAHTRELAYQITKEFNRFSKFMPLNVHTFIGGMPIDEDRGYLQKELPQIVIGTPGRLKALIEEKALDVSKVKHFIIDECDNVLSREDMRSDVQHIFVNTPKEKQVMMFSATLSDEMRGLCKRFMRSPTEIYVDEGEKLTLHGLQQYYVQLTDAEKQQKLIDLLDTLEFNQCVIFAKSIGQVESLNKLLTQINFPSTCIHAGLQQHERLSRYQRFKEFKSRIMVSTDLFGRGIDMERVNVVINYDMPQTERSNGSVESAADSYLHRVGRAGRFGTKGLAISFIGTQQDGEVLNKVQSRFVVNVPELPSEIDSSSYMG